MIPYLPLKEINSQYEPQLSKAIENVMETGWYIMGEECKKFEYEYSEYIGTEHCISCGNGYDALWLIFNAYKQLGILKDRDKILVPANTFIASVLAITHNNLQPIFIEPNAQSYLMGEEEILNAIDKDIKGVLLVHLYGQNSYTDKIGEECRRRGIIIVEDNAQAHGALYKGRRTGSLGDAAAHSFYPGKNLGALGDGGAITTDNAMLADSISQIHNYGSKKKYIHDTIGVNSRLDELQAAVLRIKLSHLDTDNERRRQIAKRYNEEINNTKVTLPRVEEYSAHVFHIFPLMSEQRNELASHLESYGIQTQIHYPIPPHKQQCYSIYANTPLPITEMLAQREISIPCHPMLSDCDVTQIIDAINSWNI